MNEFAALGIKPRDSLMLDKHSTELHPQPYCFPVKSQISEEAPRQFALQIAVIGLIDFSLIKIFKFLPKR